MQSMGSAGAGGDEILRLDDRAKELLEQLKTLRRELAEEFDLPAFMIFTDRVLRLLAHHRPTSRAEFLKIKGVGPRKFESVGERFLAVIRNSGE